MNKKGFSLIELIVVIGIITILSTVSYIAIQKTKENSFNNKVLDDLIAIGNALEQYQKDHYGKFPIPQPGDNQNLNCYNADATYSHTCEAPAEFVQGTIDTTLLTKRYLQQIPLDPYTGGRYAYGVTLDGKYFQVAGLWRDDNGNWSSRSADNLYKGFHLPSLVRAYDGPNFVVQRGGYLPYNPTAKQLSATLQNYTSAVVAGSSYNNGIPVQVFEGQTIVVSGGPAELYFSDGSITTLEDSTTLTLSRMELTQNDDNGIVTKIRMFLEQGGRIWNKVARLASKSEFQVETSSAIAGVRGTEFGIDGTGAVEVRSGTVWVRPIPAGMREEEKNAVSKADPQSVDLVNASETNPGPNTTRYYPLRLSNNVIPRVLSVTPSLLTVENLFVTMQVEDPGINGPMEVTGIEVLSGGVLQQLWPIPNPADPGINYPIPLNPGINRTNLTVRFIYEGAHPTRSAESRPPLTLNNSASSFTSDDLDRLADPGINAPGLSLLSPNSFTIRNLSNLTFMAGLRLRHLDSLASLRTTSSTSAPVNFTAQGSCTAPTNSVVTANSSGRGLTSPRIQVNVTGVGDCTLTASVALADGTLLSDSVVVEVRNPNSFAVGGGGPAPTTVSNIAFRNSSGNFMNNNTDLIIIEPGVTPLPRSYSVFAEENSSTSRPVAAADAMTCTGRTDGLPGVVMTLPSPYLLEIPSMNEPRQLSITCTIGSETATLNIYSYRRSATMAQVGGNNVYLIYSLFGNVSDWTTANNACENLDEGGSNDWHLPERNFLRQPSEIPVWCDYDAANNACRNMPNNQLNIWAEENGANTSQAYRVRPTGIFTSVMKTTQYGYRCVRVAP